MVMINIEYLAAVELAAANQQSLLSDHVLTTIGYTSSII